MLCPTLTVLLSNSAAQSALSASAYQGTPLEQAQFSLGRWMKIEYIVMQVGTICSLDFALSHRIYRCVHYYKAQNKQLCVF